MFAYATWLPRIFNQRGIEEEKPNWRKFLSLHTAVMIGFVLKIATLEERRASSTFYRFNVYENLTERVIHMILDRTPLAKTLSAHFVDISNKA